MTPEELKARLHREAEEIINEVIGQANSEGFSSSELSVRRR